MISRFAVTPQTQEFLQKEPLMYLNGAFVRAAREETIDVIEPTVLVADDNTLPIVQEEIFGPVLVAIPFESDDEAIRMANDNIYGLAGSVWTKDISRAMKYSEMLDAGLCGSTITISSTATCHAADSSNPVSERTWVRSSCITSHAQKLCG